jgi:hypothetical protein
VLEGTRIVKIAQAVFQVLATSLHRVSLRRTSGWLHHRLMPTQVAQDVNWRTVLSHGWYFLGRHQDEVIKRLTADDAMCELLKLQDNLKDWKKDYRVLLNYQNVQALLDLIPSESNR